MQINLFNKMMKIFPAQTYTQSHWWFDWKCITFIFSFWEETSASIYYSFFPPVADILKKKKKKNKTWNFNPKSLWKNSWDSYPVITLFNGVERNQTWKSMWANHTVHQALVHFWRIIGDRLWPVSQSCKGLSFMVNGAQGLFVQRLSDTWQRLLLAMGLVHFQMF